MTMTDEEILVAFGVDLAYAPHLATVIASVVANAPGARFRFMVIHDGLPDEEQAKIAAAAPGQAFQWCRIGDSRVLGFVTRDYISRATYYRFAIPGFAPAGARRAIYLDSDLVVLGDLRELWQADLGGAPVGAVHDGGISAADFAAKWDLEPADLGYLNAGVLVLDLEEIRARGLFDTALGLLGERWDDFPWGDQDALNLLLWGQWARLDARWNVQRRMLVHLGSAPSFTTPERLRARGTPKIVHYTEAFKPWLPDAWHPLAGLYFRYLKHTPYWPSVNAAAGTTRGKRLRHALRTSLTLAQLKGFLPLPKGDTP